VGLRMKGKSKKQKSRNKKKQKYIKLAITLSIVIVIILFCNFQNKHLETTHYTYAAEQLGADLEGYRIVQISDLHNAKFGKNNQKLVDRIRECEPDMIVLTGDLVDSNHTNVDRAVQFVDEIVKICPVYYVTGNHEYWLEKSEYDELMDGLIGAGVVILDDQVVEISRGMRSSGWSDWTIKVLRMGHWRRCLVMKRSSRSFLHMSHNTLPGMPTPVLISCFPDMPTADSSDCRLSAG